VTYNDGAVGVLDGLSVIDISQAVDDRWRGTPYAMTNLIERWEIVAPLVDDLVTSGPRVERGDVRLGPPGTGAAPAARRAAQLPGAC
jgi:hypothetical protein